MECVERHATHVWCMAAVTFVEAERNKSRLSQCQWNTRPGSRDHFTYKNPIYIEFVLRRTEWKQLYTVFHVKRVQLEHDTTPRESKSVSKLIHKALKVDEAPTKRESVFANANMALEMWKTSECRLSTNRDIPFISTYRSAESFFNQSEGGRSKLT